jgi:hypothetical protein
MAGPIRVDLETAQQCNAIGMIEYLFAYCNSGDGKDVPECNKEALLEVFKATKDIAKLENTVLTTELSKL